MNEAQQRRFYFPIWNSCAVANNWIMSKGRLRADLTAQREEVAATWDDPAREVYLQVLTMAEQLALKDHGSVTADHLRRACNWVASSGRHLNSGALDNKQTNRVAALFKLLTDPLDLDAVMNWLHPEKAEQSSYVAYLRKQGHAAALIAISRNAYGTPDWESLPIEKLRWMCKQMKHRSQRAPSSGRTYWRQKLEQVEAVASNGRELDPENAPY